MPDRSERLLKVVCLGLAALLIWQVSRGLITANPLANLTIPAVPTLPDATNSAAVPAVGPRGTNASARGMTAAGVTNSPGAPVPARGGSNAVASIESENQGTNGPARRPPTRRISNSVPDEASSLLATNGRAGRASLTAGTNDIPRRASTNLVSTNAADMASVPTGDTNNLGTRGARRGATVGARGMDAASAIAAAAGRRGGPAGLGGMGGPALPELPAVAKARVERIYLSQLLGPITPPVPASLLGIAGDSAIIRGTNGQTGWVKEGDLLGGIKLLKIGVNRVLIDEGGQKKELMIFSGFGGESLMSKPADNNQ